MSVLQKNKKLAAGIGVAAAAAAVLAVGAGTYASFIDTENVPDTTFAAGTLDLTVGNPVAGGPTSLTNLAPGNRVDVSYSIDNVGTVDGTLSFSFSIDGEENGCVEPEVDDEAPCTDASELVEVLEVYSGTTRLGKVTDFDNQSIPVGALPAAPPASTYTLTFVVPGGTGNEIMTDTAVITAVATLAQAS